MTRGRFIGEGVDEAHRMLDRLLDRERTDRPNSLTLPKGGQQRLEISHPPIAGSIADFDDRLVDRLDDNSPERVVAFRPAGDTVGGGNGVVHDLPIGGRHRLEHRRRSGGADLVDELRRESGQRLTPALAIAGDVDAEMGVVVAEPALAGNAGNVLQRQERGAAWADQDAEIVAVDVDLELDAVLLDHHRSLERIRRQQPFQEPHGLGTDHFGRHRIAGGPGAAFPRALDHGRPDHDCPDHGRRYGRHGRVDPGHRYGAPDQPGWATRRRPPRRRRRHRPPRTARWQRHLTTPRRRLWRSACGAYVVRSSCAARSAGRGPEPGPPP